MMGLAPTDLHLCKAVSPEGSIVVLVKGAVLRGERGFPGGRLSDDHPVEWVPRPAFPLGGPCHSGKRGVARPESQRRLKGVQHQRGRLRDPSDLMKVLQLEANHRRNPDLVGRLDSPDSRLRYAIIHPQALKPALSSLLVLPE